MKNNLHELAAELVAKGKGILAADESEGTCGKRFDMYGIAKTPDMRRACPGRGIWLSTEVMRILAT